MRLLSPSAGSRRSFLRSALVWVLVRLVATLETFERRATVACESGVPSLPRHDWVVNAPFISRFDGVERRPLLYVPPNGAVLVVH